MHNKSWSTCMPKTATKTRSPWRVLLKPAAVLMIGFAAQAGAQQAVWVPGEPYPVENLKEFACHDYTLPCGKKGSPAIEKVSYTGPRMGDPERGKKIATNVRWGNCMACHALPDHDGGTIAPGLEAYGTRNAPFEYTFQRIWDGRVFNPNAHMPVYGPNQVLTVRDILDVIAYIETGR